MQPYGTISSLYRTYLREIKRLPSLYLRQFFQLKASDDLHAVLRTRAANLRNRKLKRVHKDLRKIQTARQGDVAGFHYILNLAYGRNGKLKRELMDPLLRDPVTPLPPYIIPSVEKSRPPVYSSELRTLLMSGLSRRTKPLSPKSLASPPPLPGRADPTSEEARLLGRLSKRREINIRWRYFTTEWAKVYPPLQVVVEGSEPSMLDLARAGVRSIGFQGIRVFEEIERIAGSAHTAPPLTRREMKAGKIPGNVQLRHPSRWLRQRYRQLLFRTPILTYVPLAKGLGEKRGKYVVSSSPGAFGPSFHPPPLRLPEVSCEEDKAWLRLTDESVKK
ncbi:hypothetical protein BDZ94DRAFT_1262005 [Collybia nuda]|uniref:LYR motif-containing protein Cup1-like N-terminal domain-containing protein n=1 Tax=Collybia nuda TaxID=64659 RepID=A0A9P6CIS8_9AGAR|nr:hypothetical protein BDZ94DRAFT_1262005 [Collybia nuda]